MKMLGLLMIGALLADALPLAVLAAVLLIFVWARSEATMKPHKPRFWT